MLEPDLGTNSVEALRNHMMGPHHPIANLRECHMESDLASEHTLWYWTTAVVDPV